MNDRIKTGYHKQIWILGITLFWLFVTMSCQGIKKQSVLLPVSVEGWIRSNLPKRITSKTIFKYMDGAGELYLGYLFDHLDVYEYVRPGQNNILVELYFMKTSDDSFGLLSLDWDGESVLLDDSPVLDDRPNTIPSSRSLYGAGLLRLWSSNLYARVMAYEENNESKKAVVELGRSIVKNRTISQYPKLISIVPVEVDSTWMLQHNRVAYFRSYLVLNSIYFLSSDNILDLDHSAEAVVTSYENTKTPTFQNRFRFISVKYENPERAERALNQFHRLYLPDRALKTDNGQHFSQVEDGWMGYNRIGQYVTMVFECPDPKIAKYLFNQFETQIH